MTKYTCGSIRQLIIKQRGLKGVRNHTQQEFLADSGAKCMSKTIVSLVWVSKKTKTLSEMQDRPTTTHYSTSSSTNKQETMGFLNKQCFSVVIITIPSLSNIHQSAAFYQKNKNKTKKHTNQTKNIFIITKRFTSTFTNRKWRGWNKTACSFLLKSFNKKDRRC